LAYVDRKRSDLQGVGDILAGNVAHHVLTGVLVQDAMYNFVDNDACVEVGEWQRTEHPWTDARQYPLSRSEQDFFTLHVEKPEDRQTEGVLKVASDPYLQGPLKDNLAAV
jgi:hypothetical protein